MRMRGECVEEQQFNRDVPAKSSGYVVPDGYVLMPIVPTIEMMRILRNRPVWPGDWNAGKLVQREMGTAVVPPVTEMECACGQYQRLLRLGKGGNSDT